MASSAIHLAIAKKYIKKHNNLNYKEFIKGTLYPDAETNKFELHYPISPIIDELAIGVYNKVNLYAFLMDYPKPNDFELGWFLHLVTDYLFFQECFSEEYLKNIKSEDFTKELYHSYDCLDSYVLAKYNITKEDYEEYPSQYCLGIPYEKGLLTKELVDSFINRVSEIDLDKYIKKIKEYQSNIKP